MQDYNPPRASIVTITISYRLKTSKNEKSVVDFFSIMKESNSVRRRIGFHTSSDQLLVTGEADSNWLPKSVRRSACDPHESSVE